MLNWIKRLFGFHDSYGLRHSIDHLDRIKDEIPFWPLEKQSEYADAITSQDFDDDKWIEGKFQGFDPDDRSYFDLWNTTSIGNLALIALKATDPEIRFKATRALHNYREWCMEPKPKKPFQYSLKYPFLHSVCGNTTPTYKVLTIILAGWFAISIARSKEKFTPSELEEIIHSIAEKWVYGIARYDLTFIIFWYWIYYQFVKYIIGF